jgi:hypothetical protein
MSCPTCRRLKAEIDRLEKIHGEKARMRAGDFTGVRSSEHARLRSEENEALLALEIAKAKLNQHKGNEHGAE